METTALVAPVTALHFLQEAHLLAGEGPVLTVYSLQPRPKASASLSVLQHYRIHGIRPRAFTPLPTQGAVAETHEEKRDGSLSTTTYSYELAVFGGKAVRLVRLHLDHLHDGQRLHLETSGPLVELQDWALDVRWLSEGKHSLLCVAVAHNGALLLDVRAGHILAQRSCLEGCLLYSALLLVHDLWEDTVVVGGTVFNQLILWKAGGEGESNNSDRKAQVERRLLGHRGVIFSISYLQEKGWLASASDDRSVRLWAVGDLGGQGGKCGDLNPSCLRVLFGHQARVFSVRLSPGKVFSAGEDGACLVWDCARGGTVVRTLKGHRAGGVRSLAISDVTAHKERWVATGGADGGVRLWRVEESEERRERLEEATTEKLTDLKFSGQGSPKVVCITGTEDENWSQCKFLVCTDQGVVYQYGDGQWEMLWKGASEFQSYCVMETVAISAKNSSATINLCAVGNLSGSIQVFPTSQPQSGILLTAGAGKVHSLIWHKGETDAYLLASGADGLVHRWCIEGHLNENSCITLSVRSLPVFVLPPCAKRWLTAAVCRGRLWVCGDRRGSLILFQEGIEENWGNGSCDGKEMTQKAQTDVCDQVLQPLSCLFGVHGKQGVTSVCEHQGLLYSTGRDGCVRIFRVKATAKPEAGGKDELRLEVLRVQRACKGMEWLERVLILKPELPEEEEEVGEDCEQQPLPLLEENKDGKVENKGREARFAILGFHAVHFVVWDPVKQERLLAVPCGGGHRSWSLWPSHKRIWPGYGALVFIKQGAVLTSQPPGEAPSWAGTAARPGGWGLRDGVHGRGIGCVCRVGTIRGTAGGDQVRDKGTREERRWEIAVTGGEDTSVTILAVHPNSGIVKVLSVITDHISSVRTLAVLTSPKGAGGNQPQALSALLVSASGRAQLQCYRLLVSWDEQRAVPSCQVIQVAGHRLDEHWERRRNRHKMVKMDPETRYMSIAVLDERTDCVLAVLACSDGAVRIFAVSEVKCQIDLLWETFYHQRCVLSVATYSLTDGKGSRYWLLFSAATDGKISVWDLTEMASISSTDNPGGDPAPPILCLSIPAHQSGINSLAVWAGKQEQQDGGCLVTVASGGDDGQLMVSTIRVQYPEDDNAGGSRAFSQNSSSTPAPSPLRLHLHAQSRVSLAHAAPLTALKLLSPSLIVTTSSDQRVCLWRICSAGIRHRGVLCSHVADAAGLAVWEEGDERREASFESEERWSQEAGLETKCKTGGRPGEGRRAAERRAETGSGTVGPYCEIIDDSVEETTSECRHQEESDKGDEAEEEVGIGASSQTTCEGRTGETGWVLVCGQGLQLLRVRNTQVDEEDCRRNTEADVNTVKVTFRN